MTTFMTSSSDANTNPESENPDFDHKNWIIVIWIYWRYILEYINKLRFVKKKGFVDSWFVYASDELLVENFPSCMASYVVQTRANKHEAGNTIST